MAKSQTPTILKKVDSWGRKIKRYDGYDKDILQADTRIANAREDFSNAKTFKNVINLTSSIINYPINKTLSQTVSLSSALYEDKIDNKYIEYYNKHEKYSASLPSKFAKNVGNKYKDALSNQSKRNYNQLLNDLQTIKTDISSNEIRKKQLVKLLENGEKSVSNNVLNALKGEMEIVRDNLTILNKRKEVALMQLDTGNQIEDEIKKLKQNQEIREKNEQIKKEKEELKNTNFFVRPFKNMELGFKEYFSDRKMKAIKVDEELNGQLDKRMESLKNAKENLSDDTKKEKLYQDIELKINFNNVLQIELSRISSNFQSNNLSGNNFLSKENFTKALENRNFNKINDSFVKLHNKHQFLEALGTQIEKLKTSNPERRSKQEIKVACMLFDDKYPNMKTDDIIADMQKMAQKYPQAGFNQVTKSEIYTNPQQLHSLALYKMLKLKEEAEGYINQGKVEVVIENSPNIVVETATPNLETQGNKVVIDAKQLNEDKTQLNKDQAQQRDWVRRTSAVSQEQPNTNTILTK
jgi:hypothetical protein